MRTDSLFYLIFQTQPSILFELLGDADPRASTYSFASQEVKQTSFRIDGIFVPPIHAADLPIFFVEIQGYKDTKKVLYSSFFSQIFLYLHDYQPVNDWRGILIFTKRSLDPGLPRQYQDFADSQRFQRIYLDRLSQNSELSIGLSLLQLISLQPKVAPEKARQLIGRVQNESNQTLEPRKILELIETICVYKFPELSRKEIESMLGLSELKQTKVYQEALEEGREAGREEGREEGREAGRLEGELRGKLAAVPLLIEIGMNLEQIAQKLGIDIQAVRQVAASQSHE